jgi:hypothetical protein
MRIFAILLLLGSLVFAGLGVAYYIQHTDLLSLASSHLAKSEKLYKQAVSKQGTAEGDKLMEEADTSRRYFESVLDISQQPKGYATMNWIISGVAMLLSITFFIILSRRKRAFQQSMANYAAS